MRSRVTWIPGGIASLAASDFRHCQGDRYPLLPHGSRLHLNKGEIHCVYMQVGETRTMIVRDYDQNLGSMIGNREFLIETARLCDWNLKFPPIFAPLIEF